MTDHDDHTEIDTRRPDNPLAPLFERAARAAAIERPGTSPVRMTLVEDEWLLLSGDDAALADHGRWIASDAFLGLSDHR